MQDSSPTSDGPGDGLVLLTGATGYVGQRLLRRLEEVGASVRCLARSPEKLKGDVAESTEVVQGDVLDRASLDAALQNVQTAYYLVHLMANSGDFEEQDREAAGHFAAAAREAGVKRIAQKVGEEGVETALAATAGDSEELLNESADLLYHLLVLLRARNLELSDLAAVLRSRHGG